MTDAWLQLPLRFDIQRLQQDLQRLQQHSWQPHLNQQVHDGGWTALPLRAVDGDSSIIAAVETDPQRYQATRHLQGCSYLPDVLARLSCPQVSARLMRLRAGEEIRRHTDLELSFEDGWARLHIPIQTHPDVIFHINDQPVHFAAGECWYMNANYPHQVMNNSPVDRVHLVVDCKVNSWLESLFDKAGYEPAAPVHKYGSAQITDNNALQIAERLEAMATETSIAMAQQLRQTYHSHSPR